MIPATLLWNYWPFRGFVPYFQCSKQDSSTHEDKIMAITNYHIIFFDLLTLETERFERRMFHVTQGPGRKATSAVSGLEMGT
jgi:hypothetical protein